MSKIVLYSKEGCHLCEEAAPLVRRLARELGMQFQQTDISSDASLLARYRFSIPVVELDGEVVDWGIIREEDLRARLRERVRHGRRGA